MSTSTWDLYSVRDDITEDGQSVSVSESNISVDTERLARRVKCPLCDMNTTSSLEKHQRSRVCKQAVTINSLHILIGLLKV